MTENAEPPNEAAFFVAVADQPSISYGAFSFSELQQTQEISAVRSA